MVCIVLPGCDGIAALHTKRHTSLRVVDSAIYRYRLFGHVFLPCYKEPTLLMLNFIIAYHPRWLQVLFLGSTRYNVGVCIMHQVSAKSVLN